MSRLSRINSESTLWALHPKATLWTFYPDRLRESSVLDDLLDDDIRLTIKELPGDTEEDKTCSVCQNEYQANYTNLIDGKKISDAGELPIKLPICGHVFGHDCLQTWAPNNTCPLCREPLLYSTQVIPGYIELDIRDCGLIADLNYAVRLMRLLREFDELPGPPRPLDFSDLITDLDYHAGTALRPRPRAEHDIPIRRPDQTLSLIERRGRRRLRVNTGTPQAERPPLPEALRIVPPPGWVEANAPAQATEVPSLLERRGRRPLRVNTDFHTTQRVVSADAQPRAPTRSPIRRRERYIPRNLFEPQIRPRHPNSLLEYRLYTWLLAHGVDLPGPLDPNSTTSENEELTPRQEQALFEYIQSQGAFHYPRMDPWFQNPNPSSDRDVYEQLRRMGVFWQPCGAWGRTDGSLVFISPELAERLRRQRERERDEMSEREVNETALETQQRPPTDTDAGEPVMGPEMQRPVGTQNRRVCLFRHVSNQLFGRDTAPSHAQADGRTRPRWLRLGWLRR